MCYNIDKYDFKNTCRYNVMSNVQLETNDIIFRIGAIICKLSIT